VERRLSEMDSGSIVFAGRTGRGGKAAGDTMGGVARGEREKDERQRCRRDVGMGWEGGKRRTPRGGRDGGSGDSERKSHVSSRNFPAEAGYGR